MKRKGLVLLGSVLLMLLAACGGKKEEVKTVKEYVYRMEEVDINGIEKSTISKMFLRGERMYILCNEWDGDNGSKLIIESRNQDGSDSLRTEFNMTPNQSTGALFTADDAGDYYAVLNEYFEDATDPDNYIWENKYYLIKIDNSGKELWRQELKSDSQDNDYYGANWIDVLKDGRIGLLDGNGISLYDTDGNLVKRSPIEGDAGAETAFLLEDGTVIINSYSTESNKYILNKLDVETGKLTGEYTVGNDLGSYSYYPGVGWDMLLVGNSGVYGYNLGDEQATQLMNLIDSDINSSYLFNIVPISKTEFYAMYNDNLTNETTLARFTKVNPEDVVEKRVLTLGCYGLDWDIRNQVIAFNKTNPQYRVTIRDYTEFNTENDYEAGITKLNTDIASGNVPDILVLQNNMPVESYLSKGLFEDLYPYIDKDEDLDRNSYFANVLKAFESNGKLYQMIPSFTILTVAGKQAEVGEKEGWTLQELNDIMAKKPEGTLVFYDMTKSTILSYCMQMGGVQYINWETGECKFNSENFLLLLEFLKQFPDTIEYEENSDMRSYESKWRSGEVLLNMMYLSSFDDYNDMTQRVFGEEITLKGFPSEGGKGAVIMPNMNLVMSAKSSEKEGAWEFMRYFISEEYQSKLSYGWPLSLKYIDTMAEKAMKRPSYEDENGNIIEYDPTYMIDGIEIVVAPITQPDIDMVMDYVSSIDQVYSHNQDLLNIIMEEAAPYFSGQKNTKEVADIIQSRVQIYVNENR